MKGGGKPARPAPLLVVGWDGADWKLLDPLMQRGPPAESLGARRARADLEPRDREPDDLAAHLDDVRDGTVARGPRRRRLPGARSEDADALPISGWSRKVPAIWNVASAKGLKVGVVGWWATWPAEKVNGFFVSDRASPVLFRPRC